MTDSDKSPNSTISSTGSFRRASQPCPVHATKRGDLFCLTCECVICSKCLTDSREHARHVIDTVKETYARRFQETQIKLDTLDRYIAAQQRNAELRRRLLDELRANEAALIDRLDRIVNEAKAEVQEMSKEKASHLDPLDLATKLKSFHRNELVTEIANLSEAEFLALQTDLNRRCDFLMRKPVHSPLADPLTYYCKVWSSLIPEIAMDSHWIKINSKTSLNISYDDRYGYRWSLEFAIESLVSKLPTVSVQGMDKLQLKVKFGGSIKRRGHFQVVLEIVHDLPLKTIMQRIPFKSFHASNSRHISSEIADIAHLRNEGFVTKDDQLQLKIGIGPEDPTTERNCYQHSLEMHRNESAKQTYFVSYFHAPKCPTLASKKPKTVISKAIMDEHGVKWQLKVEINQKNQQGFIGVFLRKCNGTKAWYDYFIELVHPQSQDLNRIIKGCHLFDEDSLRLAQFMTMSFQGPFMDDDGTLRFRFGTRKDSQQTYGLTI